MDIPKSTYYFEINKVDRVGIRNSDITYKIVEIFNYHKSRYVIRRVYRELVNLGYTINHKTVQKNKSRTKTLWEKSQRKASIIQRKK